MNKGIMKNTGVGIFFIMFALIYLLGTSRITSFSPFGNRGLDSQSIPQMLGALMCALALLQVVLTMQKNKREMSAAAEKNDAAREDAKERVPKGNGTKKLSPVTLGSVGLLIAYVLVYQRLGFVLSTCAYLLAAITLLTPPEKRGKMIKFIIPFSIVVSCSVYFIFTKYLTLFLPSGILG